MKLSTAKTFTLAFLPGNAKSRSVKIYVVIASSELRSTSIHVFGDPDIEFDLGFTLAFFFFFVLRECESEIFQNVHPYNLLSTINFKGTLSCACFCDPDLMSRDVGK